MDISSYACYYVEYSCNLSISIHVYIINYSLKSKAMYYEINIAKARLDRKGEIELQGDGKPSYTHYFATAERSLTNENTAKDVYRDLRDLFPSPLYDISVTYWQKVGEGVDWADG